MAESLDENGVVEEDYEPWGELVVLYAKPHEGNVLWNECQQKLCVSYQKLNQVTFPFTFPIPFCDEAVQEIDTEAKYFISVDTDSGYWQVLSEEEARKRLALLTLDRKRRWKVMPMGDLNKDPTFLAMITKLQM